MLNGIVKAGLSIATGIGVSTIVSSYCKPVITENKGIKKACVILGTIALSGAVSAIAEKYVKEQVDAVDKAISVGKKVAEASSESKPEPKKKDDEYKVCDLIFESKEDAEEVEKVIKTIVKKNKVMSVKDLYSTVGKKGADIDGKYGWKDDILCDIVELETGLYKLILPKPEKLEGDK